MRGLATLVVVLLGFSSLLASARPIGFQPELDTVVSAGAVNVMATVVDGRKRWNGVSGVRDVVSARPAPADGRVRIGSTTKTFVAP